MMVCAWTLSFAARAAARFQHRVPGALRASQQFFDDGRRFHALRQGQPVDDVQEAQGGIVAFGEADRLAQATDGGGAAIHRNQYPPVHAFHV